MLGYDDNVAICGRRAMLIFSPPAHCYTATFTTHFHYHHHIIISSHSSHSSPLQATQPVVFSSAVQCSAGSAVTCRSRRLSLRLCPPRSSRAACLPHCLHQSDAPAGRKAWREYSGTWGCVSRQPKHYHTITNIEIEI